MRTLSSLLDSPTTTMAPGKRQPFKVLTLLIINTTGFVYQNSKKAVIDVQSSGKICILDVEMDGVKNLKKTHLNPRFVFVKPPSMEILVWLSTLHKHIRVYFDTVFYLSYQQEDRLRNRGTETEESIKRRLDRAIEELRFGEIQGMFDLTITNDDFEKAYEMLRDFIVEVRPSCCSLNAAKG